MKELVYYFNPNHCVHNVNLACMAKFMIETREQFMKDYSLTSLDEVFEKRQLRPGFRVFKDKNEAMDYAQAQWGSWAYHIVKMTIDMYELNGGASE